MFILKEDDERVCVVSAVHINTAIQAERGIMHIGMPELILLVVLILAVFGAGKMPAAAKEIASGVKELRKAASIKDKILK